MSSKLTTSAIRFGLLGLGLATWAVAGRGLQQRGSFNHVPNAFALKGSPFGRTIAMAMQGPADVYFHQGEGHVAGAAHKHAPGEECTDCAEADARQDEILTAITAATDQASAVEAPHVHTEDCDHSDLLVSTPVSTNPEQSPHQHAPGESCAGCGQDHGADEPLASAGNGATDVLRNSILERIRDWRAAKNSRTNPHSNTDAHKIFIRAEVEKKLFLTYQMDPTNYSGYGAYFLFLNEASLGTQNNGRVHARRLAEATVARCLQEWENPIALLTTAAASHDMVQMLFEESSPQSLQLAAEYLDVTRRSLDQFDQVSLQMLFDGSWERFSTARQDEMSDRAQLLRKLHEADHQTVGPHASHPAQPEGTPAG